VRVGEHGFGRLKGGGVTCDMIRGEEYSWGSDLVGVKVRRVG